MDWHSSIGCIVSKDLDLATPKCSQRAQCTAKSPSFVHLALHSHPLSCCSGIGHFILMAVHVQERELFYRYPKTYSRNTARTDRVHLHKCSARGTGRCDPGLAGDLQPLEVLGCPSLAQNSTPMVRELRFTPVAQPKEAPQTDSCSQAPTTSSPSLSQPFQAHTSDPAAHVFARIRVKVLGVPCSQLARLQGCPRWVLRHGSNRCN